MSDLSDSDREVLREAREVAEDFKQKNKDATMFELTSFSRPKEVHADLSLTKEEYTLLKRGLMAYGSDDRWIVFVRGAEIFFHRSWTGKRIYEARFSDLDDHGQSIEVYQLRKFFVETDSQVFRAPESEAEISNNLKGIIDLVIATHRRES